MNEIRRSINIEVARGLRNEGRSGSGSYRIIADIQAVDEEASPISKRPMTVSQTEIETEKLTLDTSSEVMCFVFQRRIDLEFIALKPDRIRSRPFTVIKRVAEPHPKVTPWKHGQVKIAEISNGVEAML